MHDCDCFLQAYAPWLPSAVLCVNTSLINIAAAGTIVYMPSELLLSGRMTTATDVYSFGLMSEWGRLASVCSI